MKTVRLYHPHTHEGVAYDPPPKGIALRVNAADAAFMAALGLTTPPPALDDAPTASIQSDAPIAHDDATVVIDPED